MPKSLAVNNFVTNYLVYFIINFFVEYSIIWILLQPIPTIKLTKIVLILNVITHPLLWLLLSNAYQHYWLYLLLGECLVFMTEIYLGMILLREMNFPKKQIAVAIISANLTTLMLTFII